MVGFGPPTTSTFIIIISSSNNSTTMHGQEPPACPPDSSLEYPSVVFEYLLLTLMSLVLCLFVAIKYNHVMVFDRKFYSKTVSNTLWVSFFLFTAIRYERAAHHRHNRTLEPLLNIRECSRVRIRAIDRAGGVCIRYLVDPTASLAYYEGFILVAHNTSVLSLTFALDHQLKFSMCDAMRCDAMRCDAMRSHARSLSLLLHSLDHKGPIRMTNNNGSRVSVRPRGETGATSPSADRRNLSLRRCCRPWRRTAATSTAPTRPRRLRATNRSKALIRARTSPPSSTIRYQVRSRCGDCCGIASLVAHAASLDYFTLAEMGAPSLSNNVPGVSSMDHGPELRSIYLKSHWFGWLEGALALLYVVAVTCSILTVAFESVVLRDLYAAVYVVQQVPVILFVVYLVVQPTEAGLSLYGMLIRMPRRASISFTTVNAHVERCARWCRKSKLLLVAAELCNLSDELPLSGWSEAFYPSGHSTCHNCCSGVTRHSHCTRSWYSQVHQLARQLCQLGRSHSHSHLCGAAPVLFIRAKRVHSIQRVVHLANQSRRGTPPSQTNEPTNQPTNQPCRSR